MNQRSTDLQLCSPGCSQRLFYAALTLQDQLASLQQTRKLNLDQVDLLRHWEAIGRSRSSEGLSAQTQLATLDAQIEYAAALGRSPPRQLFFQTGSSRECAVDSGYGTGAAHDQRG